MVADAVPACSGGCGTQPPEDGGKGTQPPYRPPSAVTSDACEALSPRDSRQSPDGLPSCTSAECSQSHRHHQHRISGLTSGLRPGGTSLKTGLRSRRHHQPHGSYALDQLERHETPDPVRSDAVDSRFHGVQQQADAVWLQHRWCYWGESGSCVSACRSTSPARQAASSSNRGTRGRRGPVPTSAGRRHAQAYFAQADFATYWFPRAWWGRCALWDRRAGLAVP